jgi:hypothetical protein
MRADGEVAGRAQVADQSIKALNVGIVLKDARELVQQRVVA